MQISGSGSDTFLDGTIDKPVFEERRLTLIAAQREIMFDEKRHADPTPILDHFREFLELAFSLKTSYEMAIGSDKRDLVRSVTSNRTATGKNLSIALQKPFLLLVEAQKMSCCEDILTFARTYFEQEC